MRGLIISEMEFSGSSSQVLIHKNWFAGEQNRVIGRSLFTLQKKGLVLVSQLCLTLCNPMDDSKPGFAVFHCLLEFSQIHVHWVHDTIQPSHPLSSPFSSCFQSSPASGSFPVSQLFTSGGQRISASVSASVLPMNIKGWFPWGLTGWTSLLSKKLSRVFSSITVWKHQFFSTQCLYGPTLTSIHGYWKNHSFEYRSSPVARGYLAPVCEKPKFPASVTRMSQHSDSAGFQPPWRLEATVNTVPWPDRMSCWDDLIADYGGWDAGNKGLSCTWFSYRHPPAIVKEGTVPKRVYHGKRVRVLGFFSNVKVLNFLWIKFMSRTLCDFSDLVCAILLDMKTYFRKLYHKILFSSHFSIPPKKCLCVLLSVNQK